MYDDAPKQQMSAAGGAKGRPTRNNIAIHPEVCARHMLDRLGDGTPKPPTKGDNFR